MIGDRKLPLNVDIPAPNLHPELSVVLPCYNESANIEEIVRGWMEQLRQELENFEVIIINDGSTDGTGRILDSLRREFCELRVFHQLNTGHDKALRRGYEAARGRFVFQTDSNGCYDPSDFVQMWRQRGSAQLVLGKRTHRLDSWVRRTASRVLKRAIRTLFRVTLEDPNVPFRLFRNHILRGYLEQLPRGFESVNLALAVLFKFHYPEHVSEYPIPHRFRSEGSPQRSFLTLTGLFLQSLRELIQLRLSMFRKTLLQPFEASATV